MFDGVDFIGSQGDHARAEMQRGPMAVARRVVTKPLIQDGSPMSVATVRPFVGASLRNSGRVSVLS